MRAIRRSPAFYLAVIVTLALGIGANTAVFSVLDALLLSAPPYPPGNRMVEVWERTSGQQLPVSWINLEHWRRENHTFEDMTAIDEADLTLTGRGDATLLHAAVVGAGFFRLTGWQPLIGRLFDKSDDRPGAAPTAVITSEYWANRLNRDPGAIGRSLNLDGKSYRIIGILPPRLKFFSQNKDLYVPAGPQEANTISRADHGSMVVLGALKPGATLTAANADLNAIMSRLALADPGPENDHRTHVARFADFGVGHVRLTLLMLMAAVGLVLIIACANVTSLLLIRST
ncbi:MAG TPA: ABC transporter permease, partial [Bryobacteraceae bacterium]|nr:ABC transporter permease [Bryobacteraceae bacterium]